MKQILRSFVNRLLVTHSLSDEEVAIKKLRDKLDGVPRYVPGQLTVLDWDLEYVDALALVSSIDVLVLKRWNDFVSKNDKPLILDCGSNIGISVLNYKRQFPASKIIAFEPDPQVLPILRRNLQKNGATDVSVIEAAVWIKDGELKFFSEGADGSRLVTSDQFIPASTTVKTIDLAPFICDEVDLIKMDIEGAEFEVIPKLGDKLRVVRNMVIECHLDNKKIKPFAALLQTLAQVGFSVSVNSYGAWRDLIHRPQKLPNEFDQYLLIVAWRDD